MCLAVYLGSSLPLDVGSWDKENPKFYLERAAETELPRRRSIGKYLYYAGSHEGCGCGFSKDGEPPEELIKCQKNYDALASILDEALEKGAKLQIFTCWEGDQAEEPESIQSITPQNVREPAFELQELELLNVERARA